jgi:hypothetical protein
MSLFSSFDQIDKFVTDAMSFLTAISTSMNDLHAKVDSVSADVAAIKTAGTSANGAVAAINGVTDVLATTTQILGAIQSMHGDVIKALPTPAVVAPVAGEATN